MSAEELAEIREASGADRAVLVQPVLRAGVLWVGECLVATASGVHRDPSVGRPLAEVVDTTHRDAVMERYHLAEGGVLGVPEAGRAYRVGAGLRMLRDPHLLGWNAAGGAPRAGCWMVLDGRTLGFVHVSGRGLDARATAAAAVPLGRLRRKLARAYQRDAGALSGTGIAVLDDHGQVTHADRRALAYQHARRGARWQWGVWSGAMVVARPLDVGRGAAVVKVRPVDLPRAPEGLVLTPAQRRVADLLATSATMDEVAGARGIRPATVQRHRDDIYQALGVGRRVELTERLRSV